MGKRKRQWRKETDLQDVEERLEALETEKRTLGVISEMQDKDLFKIDIQGDDQVRKKLKRSSGSDILKKFSKIPGISSVAKNSLSKEDAKNMKRDGKIISKCTRKLLAKKKNSTTGPIAMKVEDEKVVSDLWETKVQSKGLLIEKDAVSIVIPAVKPPHPGQSYIPDSVAHKEIIEEAANIEIKKIETSSFYAERSIPAVVTETFDDKDIEGLEKLLDPNYKEDDNEEKEEVESNQELPPRVPDKGRKLSSRKLKEYMEKQKTTVLKHNKRERKLHKDLDNVSSLQGLVKYELKMKSKKAKANEVKRQEKEKTTKKLGKHMFKPDLIEVKLSDEVPSTLRELKPEGNLISSRFKSLQERNIIEVRVPVTRKRKYQLKTYEKRSFKDFK